MHVQRRLPICPMISPHPAFRLWLGACVAFFAVFASADAWQGPYYQEGHPGSAVEFEGPRYAIRTHDGKGFTEGAWREDGAGRILPACCHDVRFEHAGDVLVDGDGVRWTRSAPVWPLQDEPRAPLTIQIRDAKSGDPIRDFTFRYRLEAPKGQELPDWVLPRHVVGENGTTTFDAPLSCELTLVVDALDYLCHGSGRGYHTFAIQPTNTVRNVDVRLERGPTVEGIVLDAETGEPISGAHVAPLVEYHPAIVPNTSRETITDEAGRFTVHAVQDWAGVQVRHERYLTEKQRGYVWLSQGEDEWDEWGGKSIKSNVWESVEGNPFLKRTEIRLTKAAHLTGTVHSITGEPLADVNIGRDSPPTLSRSDGEFDLYYRMPKDGAAWMLAFTKPGFLPQSVEIQGSTNRLDIVLSPQYRISGRVLAPDGRPVPKFTLAVGDESDSGYRHDRRLDVMDPDGRFSIDVNGPLTNVVSAIAPGYAATHVRVELRRDMPPVELVLKPGLEVTGDLVAPESVRTNLVVSLKARFDLDPWRTLVPEQRPAEHSYSRERYDDKSLRLSDCETRPDAKGAYRFVGVAPGRYTLSVTGDGIIPVQRFVRIAEARQRLPELTITPLGYGVVAGQVFEPYGAIRYPDNPQPWPFADGNIFPSIPNESEDGIPFKADEQGRYCVSNVPAGPVSLSVQYPVTFDIIEAMSATGIVHAGHTTQIDVAWQERRAPEAKKEETGIARFQMTVGNGSAADFAKGTGIDLNVTPGAEIPNWELKTFVRVDRFRTVFGQSSGRVPMSLGNTEFEVSELPGGHWYLRLIEYPSEDHRFVDSTCWESEAFYLTVPDAEAEFDVVLPAHSVRGSIERQEGSFYLIDAVHFLDAADGCVKRSVLLDDKGKFVARFLPAGSYHVLARNPKRGWGMRRDVRVDGAVDVGDIALQPGVTLVAQLVIDEPLDGDGDDLEVQIRDIAMGISLDADSRMSQDGDEAVFDHLWQGTWEVTLTDGFAEDRRVLGVVTNVIGSATASPVVVELSTGPSE